MTLTKEQKRNLEKLTEYLRKVEKLKVENNIDLDVFMTEYKDDDISIYATEKVDLVANAAKRKSVFEKSGKERTKSAAKN
jgi:hypothetical protein